MDFPRVELAIKTCSKHLDETNSRNTEIEAVLVGYLLAVAYADYERAIRDLIAQRGSRHSDRALSSFMTYAAERLVRSIAIGEIVGMLGVFDESCKTVFKAAISETDSQAFDNLIANRHAVAHSLGANITLDEFEGYFRTSQPVLDAVKTALDAV